MSLLLIFLFAWPGWVERHVTVDNVAYVVGYFADRRNCNENERHSHNPNCMPQLGMDNGPYPAQIRVFLPGKEGKWTGSEGRAIGRVIQGTYCPKLCADKSDDPETLVRRVLKETNHER